MSPSSSIPVEMVKKLLTDQKEEDSDVQSERERLGKSSPECRLKLPSFIFLHPSTLFQPFNQQPIPAIIDLRR